MVVKGIEQRVLQRTPHLVLLNRYFYSSQLKPLLAEWMAIWLGFQKLHGLNDEQVRRLSYKLDAPSLMPDDRSSSS